MNPWRDYDENATTSLEGLIMWGWVRKITGRDKPPEPIADSGYSEVLPTLVDLLIAHGITSVDTYNGFALVNGDWPALRARYDTQGDHNTPCLEVELRLDANRSIHETYIGLGNDDATARGNALSYFCDLGLHVFLAAFWEQRCCDQVEEETWMIGDEPWTAYISPCVRRATNGVDIPVPAEFLDAIQSGVKDRAFQTDLLAIACFYGGLPDARLAEVNVNNEKDTALSNALMALPWPESPVYYSMRNFMILKRLPQSSQP